MWWWKKLVQPPKQPEFWDRADKASQIDNWSDRMDAYIELMIEDPEAYVSWAKSYWGKAAQHVRRRR